MSNNSVTLHRVFAAPLQKVFRAFSLPAAYASWIPPYGFVCEIDSMDFRAGGEFKMAFINFTTGKRESFGGKILELKADEFLKYTDAFDDPNLPGEMNTSVWFKEVSVGTEIKILQENLPQAIPLEGCYLGWQDSLDKLRKLVEPHIPDA